MEALIFPIVAFLLFFIATEIVSLRLIYDGELIIDIELLILGIRLYPTRSRKRKKAREKRNASVLRPTYIAGSFILSALPYTEISVNHLYYNINAQSYADAWLKGGISSGAIEAILTLLQTSSKKFESQNIIITSFDNTNIKLLFDVAVSIPLSALALCALRFVKERIYYKRKGLKNVGSKNERYDKGLS